MAELSDALSRIQRGLDAPKGQYNSFGKYHYRSCEDILEALKPWFEKEKCFLTLSDEIEQIGNRIYIKCTATIKGQGGSESVTAYAREADTKKGMDDSQITGAASSYARKYALNGLFCIDDNKDADSKPPVNPANPDQIKKIKFLVDKAEGVTIENILSAYKIASIGGLSEDQAVNAIQRLNKKLESQLKEETE